MLMVGIHGFSSEPLDEFPEVCDISLDDLWREDVDYVDLGLDLGDLSRGSVNQWKGRGGAGLKVLLPHDHLPQGSKRSRETDRDAETVGMSYFA